MIKNPPANAGDRHGFDPWVGKIPWRRAQQPTPTPGESHGQKSLVGCSPQGHKELDTTEVIEHRHTHTHTYTPTNHTVLAKQASAAHIFPAAAAAAKSLQSCPTLCDPIDGSPPGSPVPGILQARTLEWVAIAFSSA